MAEGVFMKEGRPRWPIDHRRQGRPVLMEFFEVRSCFLGAPCQESQDSARENSPVDAGSARGGLPPGYVVGLPLRLRASTLTNSGKPHWPLILWLVLRPRTGTSNTSHHSLREYGYRHAYLYGSVCMCVYTHMDYNSK